MNENLQKIFYENDFKPIASQKTESKIRNFYFKEIVEILKKTLDQNALVIQSTDFSHYLTLANAEIHDEQTIKVLTGGDPNQLFNLNQPDNIDSIAAQYVQLRLQNEFFSSHLFILEHKNSQDYTAQKIDSTTSYIVQAYRKNK